MTVKPGWARKRDRLRRREADAAPTVPARPPWALSAAEWRLLVITFAGGLGSIVADALIIGAAIGFDRFLAQGQHQDYGVGLAITGAVPLIAGFVVLIMFRWLTDGLPNWLRWFDIGFLVFLIVSALLIWVGLAAGVH